MDYLSGLLAKVLGMEVSLENALWGSLFLFLFVIATAIKQAVPPLVAAYAMRTSNAKYYHYKGLTLRKEEQEDEDPPDPG